MFLNPRGALGTSDQPYSPRRREVGTVRAKTSESDRLVKDLRMIRLAFPLLAILIFVTGCTHRSTDQPPAPGTAASVPIPKHPHDYIARYEGSIAEMPVVMYLNRNGRSIWGSYYYVKSGIPIPLADRDSLSMLETPYGDTVENIIKLQELNDTEYTGTWSGGGRTAVIKLHEAYPAGSYPFAPWMIEDSLVVHVRPQVSNTLMSSAALSLPDETMPESQRKFFVRSMGGYFLDSSKTEEELKASIQKRQKAYFDSSKSEIISYAAESTDSDLANDSYMYDYYDHQTVMVRDCFDDIVILQYLVSSYSGGAHGMYGEVMHVLDLKGEKELKLSDVTSAYSSTLSRLLEKWYRKQYHLQPGEKLSDHIFEDTIPANRNFFITKNGLGFIYNPYEIASFADGIIQIVIPFSDLKGKLTPWFMKRMGL